MSDVIIPEENLSSDVLVPEAQSGHTAAAEETPAPAAPAEAAPVEETVPVEDTAIVEGTAPAEETANAEEAAPAEAAALEEEKAPAEETANAEEAAPAEEKAPAQETPAAEEGRETVNYAEKTLAELVDLFQKLGDGIEKARHSKEAEAIKSAFYRRLSREKFEAGLGSRVDEPGEDDALEAAASAQNVTAAQAETAQSAETAQNAAEAAEAAKSDTSAAAETAEEKVTAAESETRVNPFEAIEAGFKSLFNEYRKERAELNRQQESERENNYTLKLAVIEDLKNLVEKQEDISTTFPAFREIQARWRAIGPVPVQHFRNVNDSYQYYVEKFYDMVKINRDLRDLDFRKNLEAKQAFCEAAEKLSENENVVEAFRELQKLHEQWKEFGPVAKEYRDSIWERFRAATSVINKKYQAYFEGQKSKQAENLVAKTRLCELVEAIADREITASNEWNALSKEIEDIQKQWKGIGFASKKDNQKIYDRFRAACDKFYGKKREFYAEYKGNMSENMDKKLSLIEQAEALKSSTEWKKATDQFINLQKQWKEIGAVPRKKSEQLWKRFRAACDEFFAERDKQAKPENDFYGNLKAKRKLVEEVNAYELKGDSSDAEAFREFSDRWAAIGFVPFKEKDSINNSWREALQAKFPEMSPRGGRVQRGGAARAPKAPRTEKDILIQRYNALQQDIDTYENNIGFFAMSKNSAPLIKQMQERIEEAKKELKELEEKIRNTEENNG
ncbi:MAG: DUF349 domain-containing protein [Bacteroidia bacterium]|nr:DUF349 domain-containing protein [Bacteroidia bacterium]